MDDGTETYLDFLRRIIDSNDELTALYDAYLATERTAADERDYLKKHRQWRKRRDVLVSEWHTWRRANEPAD